MASLTQNAQIKTVSKKQSVLIEDRDARIKSSEPKSILITFNHYFPQFFAMMAAYTDPTKFVWLVS
jgi:hypothetical protein